MNVGCQAAAANAKLIAAIYSRYKLKEPIEIYMSGFLFSLTADTTKRKIAAKIRYHMHVASH